MGKSRTSIHALATALVRGAQICDFPLMGDHSYFPLMEYDYPFLENQPYFPLMGNQFLLMGIYPYLPLMGNEFPFMGKTDFLQGWNAIKIA